jgi:uroporphyrinogen-III decarboxylase
MLQRFDKASQSWHPIKHPVQTREDIAIATACYEDCRVELDKGMLGTAQEKAEEIGHDALAVGSVGTSALMHWVEYLAGVENAHYLLYDHEAEVTALFDAMHRVLLRSLEIVCEYAPWDVIYLVENTSTTLISPAQYRAYCYPHVRQYAQVAHDAGRLLILHMCGHLKALLPELSTLPVAAFEAFTSPPIGNTTLLDGRSTCPDVCLIGGTNAALWMHPARDIIAQIEADLEPLPHHRGIVVTSAGVMTPLATPETIKEVGDWVKAYPVRM